MTVVEDLRETRVDLLEPGARVVMISGASRGIGAAVARRLLADGFRLSLGVRRPDATRAKFSSAADRVLVAHFDAFDSPSAERWVAETLAKFGRIDALINNAGMTRPLSFEEGGEDALDDLWAVNVKAPFRLIRLTLPHLAKGGAGRIVNVASTDAKRYRDESVSIAYAATKHAVLALTHAAKFAGWRHGVRVTALCPGAVDTDFTAGIPGVTPTADRIAPTTLAEIVSLILRLPNNASVAELVVNTRLESTL